MKKNFIQLNLRWLKKQNTVLGNIVDVIAILTFLFTFIFKIGSDSTNNIDTSTTITNIDSSTTNIDQSNTTNIYNDSSITNVYLKKDIEEDVLHFSISGISSKKLEDLIEKSGNIKISPNSNNNITFRFFGEIYQYNDKVPSIFKSTKGPMVLYVNNCKATFDNFEIKSFGPSPKAIIENEINMQMEQIVEENTKLICEKIYSCLD